MNVTHRESILYYDCELLFEAEDEYGQRYIAVHDKDYQPGCAYIIAPATSEDMAAFKAGQIGLKSLLMASPPGEWYTSKIGTDTHEIALTRQYTPITDCPNLLDADYYVGTVESNETPPSEPLGNGRDHPSRC